MEPEKLSCKQRSQMTKVRPINPERRYSGEELSTESYLQASNTSPLPTLGLCSESALLSACFAKPLVTPAKETNGDQLREHQHHTDTTKALEASLPDDLLPERQDQPQRC